MKIEEGSLSENRGGRVDSTCSNTGSGFHTSAVGRHLSLRDNLGRFMTHQQCVKQFKKKQKDCTDSKIWRCSQDARLS